MDQDKIDRFNLNKYFYNFVEIDIPFFILEDFKSWRFFLQEGRNPSNNWYYDRELSKDKLMSLYHLLQRLEKDGTHSSLLKEIEVKLRS